MPLLMSLDDTRRLLRQRVASREWWLFTCPAGAGASLVAQVEAEVPAADFEALLLPAWTWGLAVLPLFLVKKASLPRSRVVALLDAHGMPYLAEQLAQGGRDVLALIPDEGTGPQVLNCLAWLVSDQTSPVSVRIAE